MSGGSHLNEQHRKMLGDQGFFKQIPQFVKNMRTGNSILAAGEILQTAGADRVTLTGTAAAPTDKLQLASAQNYTDANWFLYMDVPVPYDAVEYKSPAAAAAVDYAAHLVVAMKAESSTSLTAAVIVTAKVDGVNPDGTTVTQKSATATIADANGVQELVWDFADKWSGTDVPPQPGASLHITFYTDRGGAAPGANIDLYGIRVLYRANSAITDDQLRTFGKILNSTLKGVN